MNTDKKKQIAQVNRETIIDAAEPIFFAKGFANTTIDEIAAAAQYSKRTLYAYIESKEAIYDEIAIRAYTKLYQALEKATKGKTNAQTCLNDMYVSGFNFVQKEPDYAKIILNYHSCTTVPSEDNPLYQRLYELDQLLVNLVAGVLQNGIKQKVFKPELDVAFTTAYLVSTYLGLVMMIFNKKEYFEQNFDIDTNTFIRQSIANILSLVSISE